MTTHFGYANVTGRTEQALAHLCAVTGMTEEQAWRHVDEAGQLWTARSTRVWTLLTGAGITLARPEQAAERAAVAARQLRAERQWRPFN